MKFGFTRKDFEVGGFIAYFNGGDDHVGPIEVGVVKRLCDDGAFVAYHVGDTVAKTPYDIMVPISNSMTVKGLVFRAEQLGARFMELPEDAEVWGDD